MTRHAVSLYRLKIINLTWHVIFVCDTSCDYCMWKRPFIPIRDSGLTISSIWQISPLLLWQISNWVCHTNCKLMWHRTGPNRRSFQRQSLSIWHVIVLLIYFSFLLFPQYFKLRALVDSFYTIYFTTAQSKLLE